MGGCAASGSGVLDINRKGTGPYGARACRLGPQRAAPAKQKRAKLRMRLGKIWPELDFFEADPSRD